MKFLEFQKELRKQFMPSGEKLAKFAQRKCNFSLSKVNEMKKHNVNLVVWDELKRTKFQDNYNVTGFSQFIKVDLPSSKKMWERLI